MEEMLLELFSVPVGLKKVVKVGDAELYTSDSLLQNFTKALSESEILQAFSSKMESLVKSKRMIPCYVNRGIIKLFLWKFFSSSRQDHDFGYSLAFFNRKTNAVYVLIDNNISYFGFVSNDSLAKLIIHELAHMASFNSWNDFRKLFSSELEEFYSNYYKELFKLANINKKRVSGYIFDITRIRRSGTNVDVKKIVAKTESFLDSLKKDVVEVDFDTVKRSYMHIYKLVVFADRNTEFWNELVKNKEIIIPFVRSYRKTFGINIAHHSIPFQEIYEPSEVISEYCEHVAPKEKVLKMLSLIK